MVLMRCLPVSLYSAFLVTFSLYQGVRKTVFQGVSVGTRRSSFYKYVLLWEREVTQPCLHGTMVSLPIPRDPWKWPDLSYQ